MSLSTHRGIPIDGSRLENDKASPCRTPELPNLAGQRPILFRLRGWVWAPIAFALLMLLPALSRHRSTSDTVIADGNAAPAVAGPSLDLNAEKDGHRLRFTWNRATPAIVEAERGVLWIKDGPGEQRLELDRRQLGIGSVIYWPVSNDVNFRLEVFGVSKIVSESVRSYTGPPMPKSAPVAAELSNAAATAVEPPNAVPVQTLTRETRNLTPAAVEAPGKQALVKSEALNLEETQTVQGPAPTPLAKKLEPLPGTVSATRASAVVAMAPVTQSRVPDERSRTAERFIAAKPIMQVTPTIPASVRNSFRGEVPVDLRVSVDKEGNVFRSEVLPGRADNRLLNLAADAAKRWRFTPARIDSKPVPSTVVLHFTFKNPN
jgi:outer membrane biosynthesis protein TonB